MSVIKFFEKGIFALAVPKSIGNTVCIVYILQVEGTSFFKFFFLFFFFLKLLFFAWITPINFDRVKEGGFY